MKKIRKTSSLKAGCLLILMVLEVLIAGTNCSCNTAIAVNKTWEAGYGTENKTGVSSGTEIIKSIDFTRLSSNPLEFLIVINSATEGKLLYQAWIQDNSGWKLAKAYSNDKSLRWKPVLHNDHYSIQVRVKDPSSGKVVDTYIRELTAEDLDIVKIKNINASSVYSWFGKKLVNISAVSTEENLEYKFIVKSDGRDIAVSEYQKSNSYLWDPPVDGNYTATVIARKSNDYLNYSELSIPFEVIDESYIYPELDDIKVDQNSSRISVYLQSPDPQPFWEYASGIYEPGGSYKIFSEYKLANNMFSWDLESLKGFGPGIYEIRSSVRDSRSPRYEDTIRISVTVKNPGGDINVALAAWDITVSGNASALEPGSVVYTNGTYLFKAAGNNDRHLLYAFWLQDENGYKLIKDYEETTLGQAAEWVWKPVRPGVYTVLARVKEKAVSGSYEAQSSMNFTVVDPHYPYTRSIQINSIKINGLECPKALLKRKNVRIEADASGGDSLMYRFSVINELTGGILLGKFSADNAVNWLPKKAGRYSVVVWVKDIVSGSYEASASKEVIVGD